MAGRAAENVASRAARLAFCVSIALAFGCGGQSTSRETNDGERGGGGSPEGTGGASQGGRATGGTQIGGVPNGGVSSGGAPSGGMATGGSSPCEGEDLAGACVCATASATWTTQNLFIALDRSATMAGDRWNRALETLMVLFADDALSHAGVALATFPDTAVPLACNGVTCSPEACGVPLVELARLTRESPPQDAQEYALVNALRALTPDGPAPPLTAALDGALEQAANHVSEHPDERAQVVLVTGGEGNACSEFSAGLAARAYTEQGIRTHVLGFEDGNVPLLDDIAINGGTDRALLLGNDPEANAADLIGLTHLLPGDISCDFALPLGENLDLWNIRVTLTTVNGEVLRLVQVPASGACPDRAPSMPESSFYFNDPVNPTAIVLCPAACNALSSGDYDRLDVSIGCARIDP